MWCISAALCSAILMHWPDSDSTGFPLRHIEAMINNHTFGSYSLLSHCRFLPLCDIPPWAKQKTRSKIESYSNGCVKFHSVSESVRKFVWFMKIDWLKLPVVYICWHCVLSLDLWMATDLLRMLTDWVWASSNRNESGFFCHRRPTPEGGKICAFYVSNCEWAKFVINS